MSICYGPGEGYRLLSVETVEPTSGPIRRKNVVIKERYWHSTSQEHSLARIVQRPLAQIAKVFDPNSATAHKAEAES